MTEKLKNLLKNIFKNTKLITILGIIGILFIGVSSVFGTKETSQEKPISEVFNKEEYQESLEKQVKKITTGITGDKKPNVVVTLETGIRYSYASETEENKTNKTDNQKSENDEGVKQNYITVKTADGAEKALVITEYMPQIRGVAIVCSLATQTEVEAVQNAVTAALGISSKKVFVTAKAK